MLADTMQPLVDSETYADLSSMGRTKVKNISYALAVQVIPVSHISRRYYVPVSAYSYY